MDERKLKNNSLCKQLIQLKEFILLLLGTYLGVEIECWIQWLDYKICQ